MSNISKSVMVRIKTQQTKDLIFICLGIVMFSFGYTAFILPEKFVMGAVAGISALLYYAFNIPAGISIWAINALMLVIAIKALTRQFFIRTIIGVSIMSVVVGDRKSTRLNSSHRL